MRFNGHNAGLWCPFENWHMGNAGETVADVYKVTAISRINTGD